MNEIEIKKAKFKKQYTIKLIIENQIILGKARTYKRATFRFLKQLKEYLQKKGIKNDMF